LYSLATRSIVKMRRMPAMPNHVHKPDIVLLLGWAWFEKFARQALIKRRHAQYLRQQTIDQEEF
jgi:hypothetical protein